MTKLEIEVARVNFINGYINGFKKGKEVGEVGILRKKDVEEAWENSDAKKICER